MSLVPTFSYFIRYSVLILPLTLLGANAYAKELNKQFNIDITDHGFIPSVVTVPAGQKVSLVIRNVRKLPVEFESYLLNREKIVPAGSRVRIWVGPLKPGKYPFFNDFNPDQTGKVVVEAKRSAGHAQ